MMLWESFNKNEIYILVMFLLAYTAFFILPKKLPLHLTMMLLAWGFASSTLFDFTIGGGLLDFYKVNDSNKYELTDLLTYFLFATFSYFFIYFYKVLNINKKRFIFYILGWAIVGLLMEKISSLMGVTHYQNGYKIHFSLTVFLVVQTTTALYFELVKKKLKLT
ncbi:hypothetical protein ACFSCX_24200 [Bacillus salitolerans]|uniref:Rod shape-determining protein MreD n=1 Tax=Bacillus salitolerans TaxID=1437434 RepID=A0ABW4LXK4_9BACI